MADYELTILHISSLDSVLRLEEIVQERNQRGAIVRIISPEGILKSPAELFLTARRLLGQSRGSLQASMRNLPEMDPQAEDPMGNELELRLHQQMPGDPWIGEIISQQELEDETIAHQAESEDAYRVSIQF